MDETYRRFRLTVVKAFRVKRHGIGPPNCYAAVSVDQRPIKETRCLRSANPVWNDSSFDINIQDSSLLRIEIFHRGVFSNRPDLLGEVELYGRELFIGNSDGRSHLLELRKRGSKKEGEYGSLVIQLQLIKAPSNIILEAGPSFNPDDTPSLNVSLARTMVDDRNPQMGAISVAEEASDNVLKTVSPPGGAQWAVTNSTFNSVSGNQYNIITNNVISVLDAEETKLLESLPGTDLIDVRCDEYYVCLPNTRLPLLDEIGHWAVDPDGQRVFWLHGVAGSGKSTVANTVVAQVKQLGCISVSFRFNRDIDGRNVPSFLFGNLAYQLAHFHEEYRTQLLRVLKQHQKMKHYSLRKQLKQFIVDPMIEIKQSRPVIIVVDALDESGVENEREEMLDAIAKELPRLPRFVKVLVTSRDERDICAMLKPFSRSKSINDVEGTSDDILAYIDDRMRNVVAWHRHLEKDWPGLVQKKKLGDRAGGLFIWIATASQFIRKSSDPNVALDLVLSGNSSHIRRRGPETALDELYLGILQRTPALVDSPDATKYVMGSILVVNTPLTRKGLDSLLGLSGQVVHHPITLGDGSQIKLTTSASLIDALGSILRVDNNGTIRVLHASVIDFFTTRQRCTDDDFFINKPKYNRELAFCCFRTMSNALKRDICRINDPMKMNSEVPDLKERLEKEVPEHLHYACQFWYRHLIEVTVKDAKMYDHVKEFLFTHLLHWMEVMSLLGKTSRISLVLSDVEAWCLRQEQVKSDDVYELIGDAIKFIREFYDPIRESAAHIYVSAIPFISPNTLLFKVFAPRLTDIPRVLHPQHSACSTIYEAGQENLAVAFSPDRAWFIYAQDNETLILWDLTTCRPIGVPLTGHQRSVCNIKISYDGRRICSSDDGGCIWVWDAEKYEAIGTQFRRSDGNACRCQIDFSGDNIVAVYEDGPVFVWEIMSRSLVANYKLDLGDYGYSLLRGSYLETHVKYRMAIIDVMTGNEVMDRYTHGESIRQFVVSPDNSTMACRYSEVIRLLNSHTGDVIGEPIKCPPVYSGEPRMHFSANGKRFICDVGIHDVETGLLLAEAAVQYPFLYRDLSIDDTCLIGYLYESVQVLHVSSGTIIATLKAAPREAVISPNKTQIVCHNSNTVTVWDLTLLASRQANNRRVMTVTSSPTNQYLLIGFSDDTLWLSDAMASSGTLLKGATPPAAFSPDGYRLVSTSMNHALRLWNSNQAVAVGLPLLGHCKTITAVAFFPSGSHLVSASDDLTIRIWNVSSGVSTQPPLVFASYFHSIRSISVNGSRIVCASNGGVFQTISARTGVCLGSPSLHDHWRWAALVSDDQVFCISLDGQSRLLDGQTGRVIQNILLPHIRHAEVILAPTNRHLVSISAVSIAHISSPTTVKLSLKGKIASHFGGKWVVTVSDHLYHVGVLCWDLQSGRCIWEALQSGDNPILAFSHSGNQIVINIKPIVQVRNTSSGTLVSNWTLDETFQSVAFSPDDTKVFCVNRNKNEVVVWDVESGTMARSGLPFGMGGNLNVDERYGPDDHAHRTITLSDVTNYENKILFDAHTSSIRLPTFSPSGHRFGAVLSETTICVWDVFTANILGRFLTRGMSVVSLAFSPDDSRILLVCRKKDRHEETVQILDIASGYVTASREWDIHVFAAFFPDGSQIVTLSAGVIQIWDSSLKDGCPFGDCYSQRETVDFSPNGFYMLTTGFYFNQLWDIAAHKKLRDDGEDLSHAIFSPNSCYLACQTSTYPDQWDKSDSKLIIVEVTTGAIVGQPKYYNENISCLSFSSDSTRLVALFQNGNVQIWDARSWSAVPTTSGFPQNQMLTFHQRNIDLSTGWYCSEYGERLLWLPEGMRRVWLATGGQSRRIFLGEDASELTVVDMEDYMNIPQARHAYRAGGIRWVDNQTEIKMTQVLAYMS